MKTVLSTLVAAFVLAGPVLVALWTPSVLAEDAVSAEAERPEASAPVCQDIQCPASDATTNSWCAGNGDGVCTQTPELPAGFQASSGSEITVQTADGSETISLSKAVAGLGGGGLCCGVLATVTDDDLTLYRAWAPRYDSHSTAPPAYSASYQFGNWWSSEQPDEVSHRDYRTEEDICVSWDALTVYSACKIAKGTQVFIGPGQSACCPGVACTVTSPQACPGSCPNAHYYQQSESLQIWVPNFVDPQTATATSGSQGWFRDCVTYAWPR